jgi:hypothetical protein
MNAAFTLPYEGNAGPVPAVTGVCQEHDSTTDQRQGPRRPRPADLS